MAKYPLTDRQKQFLLELADKFRQGMGSQFLPYRAGQHLVGMVDSEGAGKNPPMPHESDLVAYERWGFMSAQGSQSSGFPKMLHFHKQLVLDVVEQDFDLQPTQLQGVDTRTIGGDKFGITSIESYFENITQTFNDSSALAENTREQLRALFMELQQAVSQLPEVSDEREGVLVAAEDLAEAVTHARPSHVRIQMRMENFGKAAQSAAKIIPSVLTTAMAIMEFIKHLPQLQ